MPIPSCLIAASGAAVPIELVTPAGFAEWCGRQSPAVCAWAAALRFEGKPPSHLPIAGADGRLERVIVAARSEDDLYALAALPYLLAEGDYRLSPVPSPQRAEKLALGWALGAYEFGRYRRGPRRTPARLLVDDARVHAEVQRLAETVALARDLINEPTEALGPEQLAAVVAELAAAHGASFRQVVGEDLITQGFPAIHAVGRASHRPPRLIELSWGQPGRPRIALVGKGVCFDTGGLDIKSADGMAWMKKDMGGAAIAIALAKAVMAADLPVELQLLVPAVENAIGPKAYRPGEIVPTRTGLQVEIGNTDAEGRVILGDALSLAVEGAPELILDFATLTGAARIALGPDLPALFSNRDPLASDLLAAGQQVQDPLWRMPLWPDYFEFLRSPIADFNNAGQSRMAGAITAALYLNQFVPAAVPWAHIDTYCWSDKDRPGRPQGGDTQSLRASFAYLKHRYARD